MGLLTRLLERRGREDRKDVPALRPRNTLQGHVDDVRDAELQLSNIEYGMVLGAVLRSAPTRMLVFGLGRDSKLWAEANRGGLTVFLEDLPDWFHEVPNAETYLVRYPGLVLPERVRQTCWDIVLVDGPMGFKPEQPGRGESIQAAATHLAPGGMVFVHDYDRPAERRVAQHYLGEATAEIDRMGIFIRRADGA